MTYYMNIDKVVFNENENNLQRVYSPREFKDKYWKYNVLNILEIIILVLLLVTPIAVPIIYKSYLYFLMLIPAITLMIYLPGLFYNFRLNILIKRLAQPIIEYKQSIVKSNKKEEEKAKIWRENHPLEEHCRLAITKNPNYVADLIRYIKNDTNI